MNSFEYNNRQIQIGEKRQIRIGVDNIYEEKELDAKATTEDFSVVQTEGSREVKRKITFYSLDAIIAVGYRVNSKRGTQFRQWAITILHRYIHYEKFRVVQDRKFVSDFDREVIKLQDTTRSRNK